MTGGVTWEVLLWVISSNAVILVIAWRLLSWVNSQFRERDGRIDALKEALAHYKAKAAETFASKDGVNQGLQRVEKSIDEMKELVNQLLLEERRKTREG